MKLTISILTLVICFTAGPSSAHKSHIKNYIITYSKTEKVTESNEAAGNTVLSTKGGFDNEDKCCCNDSSCMGPGNNNPDMTCRNHRDDLSNDINLTNQNTKNQNTYILFSKINNVFPEIDNQNTNSSQKAIFFRTPTYISFQSFLI